MFRTDNTEGFSQSDINMLNTAVSEVVAAADTSGMDSEFVATQFTKTVEDAVGNAWFAGCSTADLVSAARRRLGL